MNKSLNTSQKIVIEGVTDTGEVFRPSDWAERVSGSLSAFEHHSSEYSPLLQPSINQKGQKCILLDPNLQQTNPELYHFIMRFAKVNRLRICGDEDNNA